MRSPVNDGGKQGSTLMNLKKDMLLGFSNLRDAKNDTMVGCKGGRNKRRRGGKRFFKFW